MPLTGLAAVVLLLSSAWVRRIRWRGIEYRLTMKGRLVSMRHPQAAPRASHSPDSPAPATEPRGDAWPADVKRAA
jgi:hypothetical protein